MRSIYAETPPVRTRQIVSDIAVAMWIVFWVVVGVQVHDLVTVLAVPGEQLSEAGASLASGARRIRDAVEGTPLIGGGLAAPFAALGDAGRDLGAVGEATRRAAHRLAWWLSLVTAGAPIALVLVPKLLGRMAWMRRASAAGDLRDDPGAMRLLALRAVATRPLHELRAVSADPVRDLEERPELLAALELRDLGLRGRP